MTALVPPDLIPNWIPGEKTADSSHLGWSGLTLKGYHYPDQEANIPSMRDYMIVIYEGAKAIMQCSSGGPWRADAVEKGGRLSWGPASVLIHRCSQVQAL